MAKKRAKPRKAGRQPRLRKLSQRNVVLRALRQGLTIEDACREAGATYESLRWEKGKDSKFSKEVEAAIVTSKRILIRNWGKKRPDTLAARRWPDEFGDKNKFNLQHIVELQDEWMNVTLQFIPEERLEAFRDVINEKTNRVVIKAGVFPPENA